MTTTLIGPDAETLARIAALETLRLRWRLNGEQFELFTDTDLTKGGATK